MAQLYLLAPEKSGSMIPRYKLILCVITTASVSALAQQGRPDLCPNEAKEFAVVQSRVAAKDPRAETALASCYDLGLHVQPDGKQSIHWLTEAANQGYAPAQYELGRIYLYGRGVPADYAKALLWEQKAAEQGDARAQRDLAFMYERGFGVPADPARAAEWNRKAAAQGQTDAQLQLARALDEGAGTSKNPDEAALWYEEAAKRNQPAAQLELARKLAQGADCMQAIHWYQEAAARAEVAAMYELGKLYLTGKCGADKSQALLWFTIGARFGSAESKAEAKKLARLLPVAQVQRSRLVAEQWIKEHPGSEKQEDKE
ncbi:MAG TPA: tetratricopeptide repeat protein [Candidatus Angelobacter sp.]|nr:tetratricopeptide repeat protein [Candidatus Angelobacter sp.]